MIIQKNISLKPYNTFGIDAKAAEFVTIETEEEIVKLIRSGALADKRFLILGGGSNIVFTQDYDGLVVCMATKGIEIVEDKGDDLLVEAQAGEVWRDFVRQSISQGGYGLENLAGIPGTVGAAPVQNVGAYGREAKDVIHSVKCYDIETGEVRVFRNEECRFGYRNSIFKQELAGKQIVASVTFRLSRKPTPNIEYKALKDSLAEKGIANPSPREIAQTITEIRDTKLPKPEETGSAGSFFKNPVVSASLHDQIKEEHPNLVSFVVDDDHYKLAAGWLIEQCGWKGRGIGNAGVYAKQALVLVNNGGCTGKEVTTLSNAIIADVEAKFGVTLTPEAIII